ncbi:MAG: hypothetical protein LBH05_01695 [Deferribacteraceae bacterium]|jgi:flotillin|nr:hypothetical protein [Deferribacteraceae bacterium]
MNIVAVLIFLTIIAVFPVFLVLTKRYKVIPSDKIIVIFGRVGGKRSSLCQHGGARFIWPLIQDFRFLDLTPMTIDIQLENALSKQNIRVGVPSRFTIGISTDPTVMQAAAERLLSMSSREREDNARDIIFGQLRATIATMNIEEINSDREAFEQKIMENVEVELRKIGLRLINVNITDISDESGYIKALGRKAASEAINRARVEVAEQDRKGAIGEAEAKKEERISVAQANAKAVEGENVAKISIAKSDAAREEAQAEANRRAKAAQLVQEAKALEEGYESERNAEMTRKAREEATMQANVIVPAEIKRQQTVIDAEAEALKVRKLAEGEAGKIVTIAEAEAMRMRKMGEGRGKEIELELAGRAEGLRSIVASAGGAPDSAAMLMIVEKLPEIISTQVEAIKNLKIDKITVWDSGNGKDGNTSTANFISGLLKSLPPLHDLMNSAGIKLPDYLGSKDEKK